MDYINWLYKTTEELSLSSNDQEIKNFKEFINSHCPEREFFLTLTRGSSNPVYSLITKPLSTFSYKSTGKTYNIVLDRIIKNDNVEALRIVLNDKKKKESGGILESIIKYDSIECLKAFDEVMGMDNAKGPFCSIESELLRFDSMKIIKYLLSEDKLNKNDLLLSATFSRKREFVSFLLNNYPNGYHQRAIMKSLTSAIDNCEIEIFENVHKIGLINNVLKFEKINDTDVEIIQINTTINPRSVLLVETMLFNNFCFKAQNQFDFIHYFGGILRLITLDGFVKLIQENNQTNFPRLLRVLSHRDNQITFKPQQLNEKFDFLVKHIGRDNIVKNYGLSAYDHLVDSIMVNESFGLLLKVVQLYKGTYAAKNSLGLIQKQYKNGSVFSYKTKEIYNYRFRKYAKELEKIGYFVTIQENVLMKTNPFKDHRLPKRGTLT